MVDRDGRVGLYSIRGSSSPCNVMYNEEQNVMMVFLLDEKVTKRLWYFYIYSMKSDKTTLYSNLIVSWLNFELIVQDPSDN